MGFSQEELDKKKKIVNYWEAYSTLRWSKTCRLVVQGAPHICRSGDQVHRSPQHLPSPPSLSLVVCVHLQLLPGSERLIDCERRFDFLKKEVTGFLKNQNWFFKCLIRHFKNHSFLKKSIHLSQYESFWVQQMSWTGTWSFCAAQKNLRRQEEHNFPFLWGVGRHSLLSMDSATCRRFWNWTLVDMEACLYCNLKVCTYRL